MEAPGHVPSVPSPKSGTVWKAAEWVAQLTPWLNLPRGSPLSLVQLNRNSPPEGDEVTTSWLLPVESQGRFW